MCLYFCRLRCLSLMQLTVQSTKWSLSKSSNPPIRLFKTSFFLSDSPTSHSSSHGIAAPLQRQQRDHGGGPVRSARASVPQAFVLTAAELQHHLDFLPLGLQADPGQIVLRWVLKISLVVRVVGNSGAVGVSRTSSYSCLHPRTPATS